MNKQMIIFSHSEKGIRPINEDRHFIINNEDLTVLGVCDGHGALRENKLVKYISQLMVKLFSVSNLKHPIDPQQIKKIITDIQDNLKKTKNYDCFNCGCTCTMFIMYKSLDQLIDKIKDLPTAKAQQIINKTIYKTSSVERLMKFKDKFITINIGDSRIIGCYRINNKTIIKQFTTDHKPYDTKEREMIESKGGKIEYVDGIYRIKGLSLSRALGDCDNEYISVLPDIKMHKITGLMFVIVACDGLYDVLENNEICQHVIIKCLDGNGKLRKNINPAKELCKFGLTNETTDNITVLCGFLS